MRNLNTREALLETMRELRADLDQVVAEAGEERAVEPGQFEAWSFKDIVAHLTEWRWITVRRLEAGLSGEEPVFPWPTHLNEEDHIDEINEWFYQNNRDRSLDDILAESNQSFDRVESAISVLPENDLFEVSRFPWLEGYALGPGVVEGTYEHYHIDHEPDIQAWLASA